MRRVAAAVWSHPSGILLVGQLLVVLAGRREVDAERQAVGALVERQADRRLPRPVEDLRERDHRPHPRAGAERVLVVQCLSVLLFGPQVDRVAPVPTLRPAVPKIQTELTAASREVDGTLLDFPMTLVQREGAP